MNVCDIENTLDYLRWIVKSSNIRFLYNDMFFNLNQGFHFYWCDLSLSVYQVIEIALQANLFLLLNDIALRVRV